MHRQGDDEFLRSVVGHVGHRPIGIDAVAVDGSSSPLPDAPDAMDTSRGLGTKSADKMPVKAKLAGKKKHMIDSKGSVIGAKIARKKVTKMKRRGTAKNGVVVQRKRSTKSRKKNTCSF